MFNLNYKINLLSEKKITTPYNIRLLSDVKNAKNIVQINNTKRRLLITNSRSFDRINFIGSKIESWF